MIKEAIALTVGYALGSVQPREQVIVDSSNVLTPYKYSITPEPHFIGVSGWEIPTHTVGVCTNGLIVVNITDWKRATRTCVGQILDASQVGSLTGAKMHPYLYMNGVKNVFLRSTVVGLSARVGQQGLPVLDYDIIRVAFYGPDQISRAFLDHTLEP